MFTLKGPKYCVSWTLEGSPHYIYRGGTVVQFAQVQPVTDVLFP